jgi:hypothetical protein
MVNLRAKEAERAATMFRRQKQDPVDNDDMFFDAGDYHGTNKSVANILSSDKSGSGNQAGETSASSKGDAKEVVEEATLDNLDGGQWGDAEDPIDIDMGDDIMGLGDAPESGDADASGAGGPDGA